MLLAHIDGLIDLIISRMRLEIEFLLMQVSARN